MAGSGMAQIRRVDLSFWRVDLVGLIDDEQRIKCMSVICMT
jgi:hypothetical protein